MKTKIADISFVSRVRRQLERRHLLFGEYLWSCTTLNVHYESIEDEHNIDGGKHVLSMFLNKELF